MGTIVFSTIIENLRSFFGKEDELLANPKSIPESASETFGSNHPPPKKIVDKELPRQNTAVTKTLPFTPEELRVALHKPASTPIPEATPPKVEVEHHDITYEIDEFENALRHAHKDVPSVPPPSQQRKEPAKEIILREESDDNPSFFDKIGQEIIADPENPALERDVVHKMKEFHRHQMQGKEYYLYAKDVKTAVERKIKDLKVLEREWFQTRRDVDELERGLSGIEREIEIRTEELRDLIGQSKNKSRLEQPVEEGKEFMLSDGRKLSSLLDLRIALRTMTDEVYSKHAVPGRNDFAIWVKHAVKEPALATEMERAIDRYQLEIILSKLPQE